LHPRPQKVPKWWKKHPIWSPCGPSWKLVKSVPYRI